MKQEDKELLLKDLCARLPYGVQCQCIWEASSDDDDAEEGEGIITGITDNETILVDEMECYIEDIKPYLRPMSSMTEEEKKEFLKLADGDENDFEDIIKYPNAYSLTISIEAFDWLYKHNIDFRRLIKKGLALEAPEGMYNIKD